MTEWTALVEEAGSCKWIPPRSKIAAAVRDTDGAKVRLFRAGGGFCGVQLLKPTPGASVEDNIPYHRLTKHELKALGLACIRMAMEMKDE